MVVRAGWAEDAKLLADVGEVGLVWPEFGNEGDALLEWPIDSPPPTDNAPQSS